MTSEPAARETFAGVLALKRLPEFASVQPDELVGLSLRATARSFRAGDPIPGADAEPPRVHLLLEGSVREPRSRAPKGWDAPVMLGMIDVLAERRAPGLESATESRTLEIARPALVEALEEEFEVCVALLRHVCRGALERRTSFGWQAEERTAAPVAVEGESRELAARIHLLRRLPALRPLPAHLLGRIAADMEPLSVASGAALWEPEDPASDALLILDGCLLCGRAGSPGESLGRGALAGILQGLAGGRCGFEARAREPLRGLRLGVEDLIDLLEDDPAASVRLLCAIARAAEPGVPPAAEQRE
jgi:hypothetical protein